MLSSEQVEEFKRKGYYIIENFTEQAQLDAMKDRARQLVSDFNPASISVFSTKNQTQKSDQYFLDSSNSVSFFFEEGAFDDDGNLIKPKDLAINKLGHAMHDLDPVFRSWSRSPQIVSLFKSLGYHRPLPVQSMLIFKQPGIGGEVVPHQDGTFLATQPQSVLGIWLALEDATIENGCLWALAGGHVKEDGTTYNIWKRFIKHENGTVSFKGEMPEFNMETFDPVEVKAGSLVLLHGANVHYSKENKSEKSRLAYSVHFVEGTPEYEWQPDNWLQRKEDFPFEPLYE